MNILTIKKRLFVSNILMVAISVVIAIITVAVFIFILDYTVFHGALHEIAEQTEIIEERFHDSEATIKARITMIGLLTAVGFVVLIYVINRFLTRFVFNKVEQPLEMLSYGVQQISGGNLDYRIAYYTDDEFKPICANFNEMAVKLKLASVTSASGDVIHGVIVAAAWGIASMIIGTALFKKQDVK